MPDVARRIGYYLNNDTGSTDFAVIPESLDAENVEEFKQLTAVVFQVQPILMAILGVMRNHEEYRATLDGLEAQFGGMSSEGQLPREVPLEMLVEVARRVTNLLSSSSAFLSQIQNLLSQTLGNDSKEFEEWDANRRHLHSQSFAYRFLYQLRNYCQHAALPLSVINVDGTGGIGGGEGAFTFKVRPLVDRDELLAESFNWGPIKEEIEVQPSSINLDGLISEYVCQLRAIAVAAIDTFGAKLQACGSYLAVLSRIGRFPLNAVPVLFVGESEDPNHPPQRIELIPIPQFAWIQRQYDILRES